MLDFERDRVVILFFKDFESDSLIPYDRYLKRVIRPIYNLFRTDQKISGFKVWLLLLSRALEEAGIDVRLNDRRLARKNPHYPVGLVGIPALLPEWDLPNPAILGPSLFDHPSLAPDLMSDPRFHFYLVTCDWMYDMFYPSYGESCKKWFAGMDLHSWSDTSEHNKDLDVLLYDKIRWNREHFVPNLLQPIRQHLERKGLTHSTLRYRYYDHEGYRKHLSRARSMIFLCEHETQGMAYQEALASNVPILAWDNGFWQDPRRPLFEPEPVPASSVPYFSTECGDKFRHADEFVPRFEHFWKRLSTFSPRSFVKRELSFEKSASLYLKYYASLCQSL